MVGKKEGTAFRLKFDRSEPLKALFILGFLLFRSLPLTCPAGIISSDETVILYSEPNTRAFHYADFNGDGTDEITFTSISEFFLGLRPEGQSRVLVEPVPAWRGPSGPRWWTVLRAVVENENAWNSHSPAWKGRPPTRGKSHEPLFWDRLLVDRPPPPNLPGQVLALPAGTVIGPDSETASSVWSPQLRGYNEISVCLAVGFEVVCSSLFPQIDKLGLLGLSLHWMMTSTTDTLKLQYKGFRLCSLFTVGRGKLNLENRSRQSRSQSHSP